MSKRYGRQQKRKAREALAKAERDNKFLSERVEGLGYNRTYSECVVSDMAKVFGKYFAGLDPKVVNQSNPSPDFWEIVEQKEYIPVSLEQSAKFVDECLRILRLPCMKVHLDYFRGMQHVVLSYDSKRVAYAVDPRMFEVHTKREVVNNVAKEISEFLYEGLINVYL